jgi:hypothetical protein
MTAYCKDCGQNYPHARRALGYTTCLECGAAHAMREVRRRSKCLAPAFNKGNLTYVSSRKMAKWIGK